MTIYESLCPKCVTVEGRHDPNCPAVRMSHGLSAGSDPVDSLRRAVRGHDDWPDQGTAMAVVDAARRLIRTIDQRAEMIDYMRRTVTPTQQAIQEVIGEH